MNIRTGWNTCTHRLDLGIYSHPKEFLEIGVGTQDITEEKSPLLEGCEGGTRNAASLRIAAQHTTD